VETPYGRLPSVDTEVNGEMLQVLTRLYWMTGSERYLEWARRIGDAYCYEVLQRHHGLPAHIWDFRKHTGDGRFKARDHGCEIVSGLTLLYTVEKEKDSSRAVSYFQAIANMLERIQEIAADSSSGLMYNEVDVATGELTREGFSDNWGYNYYAYYTFYMATGEEKYRDSALRVLENIHRLRDYNWERRTVNDTVAYGADGYADAIEGALGLLSHLRVESAFDWVETETRRMLSWQREDGIIEGWHGDGNFARTALMYAFYKTKGCYAAPWREDIELAAEETENGLEVYLRAKEAWQGRLFFDPPRHRHYLRMKKDYPRINAFPEWFTVEPLGLYRVRIRGGEGDTVLGDCLIKGYPLELKAGETVRLSIGPG
ncbi:MAG: hypothetical protein U9N45_01050, partial [Gemmatimonadota bacterium]|nr:hypothetical protein [Gemmatimonadota bacterium]